MSVKEQLLRPFILDRPGKERESLWRRESHTERERESSDGDQKQALNINAARLREFRAAVHQNLGERAREDNSITGSQSWRNRSCTAKTTHTKSPSCSAHTNHNTTWHPPHLDFLFDFTCIVAIFIMIPGLNKNQIVNSDVQRDTAVLLLLKSTMQQLFSFLVEINYSACLINMKVRFSPPKSCR